MVSLILPCVFEETIIRLIIKKNMTIIDTSNSEITCSDIFRDFFN